MVERIGMGSSDKLFTDDGEYPMGNRGHLLDSGGLMSFYSKDGIKISHCFY